MLIAIQFWNGDAKMAYSLAKLLADIEPGHQENADLLLAARFDTAIDPAVVQYVSRKFNVFQFKCKRRTVGHPGGCNDLWFGLWDWLCERQAKGAVYKMLFTCEGDGAPVCNDWVTRMHRVWDACQPASVVGAFLGDHINGNGLFSGHPAFSSWLSKRVVAVSYGTGWDRAMWTSFQQWGARGVEDIRSYWQTRTMTQEWFDAEAAAGTIWVHGIKDESLHQMAKNRLLCSGHRVAE
jgi:hypothetical protein